jgi:hypothetical protein
MSFHVAPFRSSFDPNPSPRSGFVPLRRATHVSSVVALVLSGVLTAGLVARAQEPQVWPQDDDYGNQQPASPQSQQPIYQVPQYSQPPQQYGQNPQQYSQPQSYPQGSYSYPPQGQQAYNDPQYGQQQYGQPAYSQVQPLSAEQIEQLVAPIALYPDAVLAQILAASTYPAQVASAAQWLQSVGAAPPEQIAAAVNGQSGWDPSVKALTAYPQVLAMMNQNLQWTTALGNAYYNQPQDLLQTVQVLRERAQSAGTLQSTPQEQVVQNQGYIALQPANPEVVYVPQYDPWAVYGQPIAPYPNYSPLDTVGSVLGTALQYGLGFGVSAFMQTPFGLLSWGLDWLANAVLFNHDPWCSHSYEVHDWGFRYGGPRAFGGREFARYGDHYGRGGWEGNRGGFNRGEGRYPIGRGQEFANHNQPGFNRGGNYPTARPGQNFAGNQGGFNRGAYPIARPGQGFAGNQGGFNRGGYSGFNGPRPTPPQQLATNRLQAPISRSPGYGSGGFQNGMHSYGQAPQQFSGYGQRPGGYSPGVGQRPAQPFGGGRGFGYTAPSQAYRAPTPSFGNRSFGGNNNYASNFGGSQHSGGFHPFGGGHSQPSFGGGGHSFGGGGGHSFGGGSHSFGGGGGHSFGGGGHSFGGGGHSSGGGHSGGHSGGGHSGGHGHR